MSHTFQSEATDTFDIVIGDRGRIVLPSALRKKLNLKKGDHLHARLDENKNIQIIDRKSAVANLCGMLLPYTNGEPIVDDFIAERRREAAME